MHFFLYLCRQIGKTMYIAIAGNIGAGKTTLTKMLARYYGWEPRFESVTFNPYLEDYYSDIPRWSFALETYFLKERFRDMLAVNDTKHTIIQDRSIFEGVYVFVTNNYMAGNLSERDYTTYMELFGHMQRLMKLPDLMIYLRKSVPALIAQIQKRGRDYEQTMQLDYLRGLNERYEDFIYNKYKGRVLVIDSDNLDFENRPEDFHSVVNRIDAELFGLFSKENWEI
ncbi:MAG: deoxynucleoside kinase [Paludibacteraceae bacterium]|nr:deoxynucleoside kinase [Paludibacteraceae bacterium]